MLGQRWQIATCQHPHLHPHLNYTVVHTRARRYSILAALTCKGPNHTLRPSPQMVVSSPARLSAACLQLLPSSCIRCGYAPKHRAVIACFLKPNPAGSSCVTWCKPTHSLQHMHFAAVCSPVDSTSSASGMLNSCSRCNVRDPLALNSSSAAVCSARACVAATSSTPPGCTSCVKGGSLRVSHSSAALRSSCCLASWTKANTRPGLQCGSNTQHMQKVIVRDRPVPKLYWLLEVDSMACRTRMQRHHTNGPAVHVSDSMHACRGHHVRCTQLDYDSEPHQQ